MNNEEICTMCLALIMFFVFLMLMFQIAEYSVIAEKLDAILEVLCK